MNMKHKKILSWLITFAMILSLSIIPTSITANAEDGNTTGGTGTAGGVSTGDTGDTGDGGGVAPGGTGDTGEEQTTESEPIFLYSYTDGSVTYLSKITDASFDEQTNTLTLSDLDAANSDLTIMNQKPAFDFRLNLTGTNKLRSIAYINQSGKGNTLRIEGTGSLIINEDKANVGSIYISGAVANKLHVSENANLTLNAGKSGDKTPELIKITDTKVDSADTAITIDANTDRSFNTEKDTENLINKDAVIASSTGTETLKLAKANDGSGSFGTEYYAVREPETLEGSSYTASTDRYIYALKLTSKGVYCNTHQYICISQSEFENVYTYCTSIPDEIKGSNAASVDSDGIVNVTYQSYSPWNGVRWGYFAEKNNKSYIYVYEPKNTSTDEDGSVTSTNYLYSIYELPSSDTATYTCDENFGIIFAMTEERTNSNYEDFIASPVETFEKEIASSSNIKEVYNAVADKGYTPVIDYGYYTYSIKGESLVISSRTNPEPTDSAEPPSQSTEPPAQSTEPPTQSINPPADRTEPPAQTQPPVSTQPAAATATPVPAQPTATATATPAPASDDSDQDEEEVSVGEKATISGATYTVTSTSGNTAQVSYKSTKKNAKKVTIPSTVTVNGETCKVTSVASNAFSGNKNLTSVSIPATITSIGKNAFKNCLQLKKITIPKNVKTISKSAFQGDKKLKTITIKSKKIKSIGKNAFSGVPKNAVIKVPASKKKLYTKLLKKAGFKGKIK